MSAKLYPVTMYLNAEERCQFLVQVKASGDTKSGFMRELCGFDPRRRGAPDSCYQRARGKRGAKKPVKPPFDLKPVKPPFDFSPDAEELAGALFRLKSGVRVRSQSNQNSTESALRSGHQIAPPAAGFSAAVAHRFLGRRVRRAARLSAQLSRGLSAPNLFILPKHCLILLKEVRGSSETAAHNSAKEVN